MKKYLTLALIGLLASCAHCNKGCDKKPQPVAEPAPVVVEEPDCGCDLGSAPCPEVKHPRVYKEVIFKAPELPCEQYQEVICHDGYCETYSPNGESARCKPEPKVVSYVPEQPELYTLAANRSFNNFIKDTSSIYEKRPDVKIYLSKGVLKDGDLPQGIDQGVESFRTSILNSHTFLLTGDKNEADYVLDTTAEWLDTPSKDVPAINYVVRLVGKNGKQVGVWSQVLKYADNRSWL